MRHTRLPRLAMAALVVALGTLVAYADSLTTNLQLLIMDSGSHSNDWGTQTSLNLEKIETAVAGVTSLPITGGTTTLSQDQARASALAISGTLSADQTLIVPSVSKWWIVSNAATLSGHIVQMKTAGGTAITIPATVPQVIWCDGTNVSLVADVSASIASLTASIATNTSNISTVTSTANAALARAGGTMTGDLVLYGSAPATSASAAPKSYIDAADASITAIANAALPKAGGTMTGNLILNGAPATGLGAATKAYADGLIWRATVSAGSLASGNGASLSHSATGTYTVNWSGTATNSTYSCSVTPFGTGPAEYHGVVTGISTTAVGLYFTSVSGGAADMDFMLLCAGM